MPDSTDDTDRLRRSATRLRGLLTGLILFLALVLVAERAGYAGAWGAERPAGTGLAPSLLIQLALAVPALLYLAALWQLRRAVAAVAEGAPFSAAVVRALRRLGLLLAFGALAGLLAMPAVHKLLGLPYPRLLDHDLATLIIAGIGLGLAFLARLVERAGTVQHELDEIF
jgi:hypothetical protein